MKVTDISCSYYYHSASWQTEISHILKGDNTASFYNENYKQNSWYCLSNGMWIFNNYVYVHNTD